MHIVQSMMYIWENIPGICELLSDVTVRLCISVYAYCSYSSIVVTGSNGYCSISSCMSSNYYNTSTNINISGSGNYNCRGNVIDRSSDIIEV